MFSYLPLLSYNSSKFRDVAGPTEGRSLRSGHNQGRCLAVNQPGAACRPRKQGDRLRTSMESLQVQHVWALYMYHVRACVCMCVWYSTQPDPGRREDGGIMTCLQFSSAPSFFPVSSLILQFLRPLPPAHVLQSSLSYSFGLFPPLPLMSCVFLRSCLSRWHLRLSSPFSFVANVPLSPFFHEHSLFK